MKRKKTNISSIVFLVTILISAAHQNQFLKKKRQVMLEVNVTYSITAYLKM